MEIFTKKAKEGEMLVYEEILDTIADVYNPTFSTLVLPKAVRIDKANSLLQLPRYDGETFNEKWNEETGGSLLRLDLSVEVPEILRELAQIDISIVFENPRLQRIPRLVFSTEEYVPKFELIAARLCRAGRLEIEEADRTREIIQKEFASPLILNNGDFYPRNFIRMPDKKIALIDWETWNANSRANIIDHPENVAAFCFVHMWANPAWQKNYVKELRERRIIGREDFQRGILIKSLEMADFWFDDDRLCNEQLRIFRNALNTEYLQSMWS